MPSPPLNEDVLKALRAITSRAFEKAKEIQDVGLMEESINVIVLIDRALERIVTAQLLGH